MKVSTTLSLLFAASAYAKYQITEPTTAHGWSTAGSNVLKWDNGAGDPLNFTAVLTNTDPSVLGINNNQILDALVVSSLGVVPANAPSGGWPTGTGFLVNFVQDPESLTVVLAQSEPFNISAPVVSSASSVPTTPVVYNSPTEVIPTDTAAAPVATTSTTSSNSASAMNIQVGIAGVIALLAGLLP